MSTSHGHIRDARRRIRPVVRPARLKLCRQHLRRGVCTRTVLLSRLVPSESSFEREHVREFLSDGEQSLLDWFIFNPTAMRRREQQHQRSVGWSAPRRRLRQAPESRPPAGSIAAVINNIEGCGPYASRVRAVRWARLYCTPKEVEAWLKSGLKTDDLDLIAELRSLGVPPEAMQWTVRKETMLDRIRLRNCSAAEVAGILRREGLLAVRAA